jgi:hypothetical protein
MNPMRIEIPFLAALVLIGTSLLARMAAQGVEQALLSTAIEYCLYRKTSFFPFGHWNNMS